MSKRTYNQYCPIAYSLDLIGERWTQLVVRELLFGPRRYKDLLAALPGIGTNLLADRLKNLEEAGILYQRKLPPPSGSAVYDLTPLGKGLTEPMLSLARWGLNLLQSPVPEGYLVTPLLSLFYMKTFFDPVKAEGVELTAEFRFNQETIYQAVIQAGQIELSTMPFTNPELIIHIDIYTFFALMYQRISIRDSLAQRIVRLERGQPEQLEQFANLFTPEV